MSCTSSIPVISIWLLPFLLVLSVTHLEGCQSAKVDNTAGAKAPDGDKNEHISNRVHPNTGKLSDKEHRHIHDNVDAQNDGNVKQGEQTGEYEYDHEAFLGPTDAHEFDDLDPEESKRRLSIIVDKIDKDNNGYVTLEEMRNWIRFTHDKYILDDIESQWMEVNQDGKDTIGWEAYRRSVDEPLDDESNEGTNNEISDEDRKESKPNEEREKEREKQRWTKADENSDGFLTKLEFQNFLHPEGADHMKDVSVKETIDDLDKDGDGKISLEEYLGNMYNDNGLPREEPDWLQQERETFKETLDRNNDGYLDSQEVVAWVLPEVDEIDIEAKHLIHESDSDSDEMLTKDEIIAKYDLFVASQATEFGEALKEHDEF